MTLWRKFTAFMVVATILFVVFASAQIIETNKSENYQVKQAAISGELSVRSEPGMYWQNFGSITTYRVSDDLVVKGTTVRFRDGSTAEVYGTVKYRSPTLPEQRIKLHREMQSYYNVKNIMIESAVDGALKQTANLFGAEEVYSTRRSEFVEMFKRQLEDGIYKTKIGREVNEVVTNDVGVAIIAKPSVLKEYGFTVVNVEIGDIDFDEKTDDLIKARKDAEQQETLARAEAERAKQDALTAEERGKASVATAKYEALVIKEREVIEAEKKTAVEKEQTLQALEIAKQEKAKGEAEAYAAKLKVAAGLSPREAAEIEKETAIGVAEHLSKLSLPKIWINGDKGASDPLTALNLKMLSDVIASNPTGKSK